MISTDNCDGKSSPLSAAAKLSRWATKVTLSTLWVTNFSFNTFILYFYLKSKNFILIECDVANSWWTSVTKFTHLLETQSAYVHSFLTMRLLNLFSRRELLRNDWSLPLLIDLHVNRCLFLLLTNATIKEHGATQRRIISKQIVPAERNQFLTFHPHL